MYIDQCGYAGETAKLNGSEYLMMLKPRTLMAANLNGVTVFSGFEYSLKYQGKFRELENF